VHSRELLLRTYDGADSTEFPGTFGAAKRSLQFGNPPQVVEHCLGAHLVCCWRSPSRAKDWALRRPRSIPLWMLLGVQARAQTALFKGRLRKAASSTSSSWLSGSPAAPGPVRVGRKLDPGQRKISQSCKTAQGGAIPAELIRVTLRTAKLVEGNIA